MAKIIIQWRKGPVKSAETGTKTLKTKCTRRRDKEKVVEDWKKKNRGLVVTNVDYK